MIIPYIVFSLIGGMTGAIALSEYGWVWMMIGMWSGGTVGGMSAALMNAWRCLRPACSCSALSRAARVFASGFDPSRNGVKR